MQSPPHLFCYLAQCRNSKSRGAVSINSLLPVASSHISVRWIQSSLFAHIRSLTRNVLLIKDLTLRSAILRQVGGGIALECRTFDLERALCFMDEAQQHWFALLHHHTLIKTDHCCFSVSAPQNTENLRSAGQNETSITLQWNKVNNNVSFILQYNDTEINISAPDGDGPVTHTVSSLSAGTKYTFTLFSVFEDVRSSGVEITAVTGKKTVFISVL